MKGTVFMRNRWSRVLRSVVALLIPGLLLVGCAASGPMLRPADFPFHASVPPVDIHWRLSLDSSVARADGLIERRQHLIRSAQLQLVGLDATGRIVSFATPAWVLWRSESDSESFTIKLRPRGGEERFEVRLYSFEYREDVSL
jgi:hypothetical protein